MRVQEYRDLISAVSDKLASARSAATDLELDSECFSLLARIKELNEAVCPTAKQNDRDRAARISEVARQFVCDSLMGLYDNQMGPMVDHC